MSEQSKKDRAKAGYQKALLNSLLDPNDAELASFRVLPEHEKLTSSEQQSRSKTSPSTPTRPQDST